MINRQIKDGFLISKLEEGEEKINMNRGGISPFIKPLEESITFIRGGFVAPKRVNFGIRERRNEINIIRGGIGRGLGMPIRGTSEVINLNRGERGGIFLSIRGRGGLNQGKRSPSKK